MRSLSEPPRLRVRGLSRSYGRLRVLEGLDLDVAPGEVVLLSGSNGSGKTTLLRCIAGLAPSSGEVLLDGVPTGASPASRAALGYLPQSPALPSWATGAELLALFGALRGATRPTVALPDGFLPRLDVPVGTLSGGQRHRIAIVVALLGAPRVLLLDEPTANLDEAARAAFEVLLREARAGGASVLVASPSASTSVLPDRVVQLVDGRIVEGRPPTGVDTVPSHGPVALREVAG